MCIIDRQFYFILEDTIVAYDIKILDYDNQEKAKFGWKSNTTELFFKRHVFNISIATENGTIIQQKENLSKKEVEISGLLQYTNYTFIIQSKNKYTYSKPLQLKFLTYGENIVFFYSSIYLFTFFVTVSDYKLIIYRIKGTIKRNIKIKN